MYNHGNTKINNTIDYQIRQYAGGGEDVRETIIRNLEDVTELYGTKLKQELEKPGYEITFNTETHVRLLNVITVTLARLKNKGTV